MISTLILPGAFRGQIADEARAAFPRECCGLIEGVREGETARVNALHPTRNLAERADRFEIDPAEHMRLLRALRGTGHEIIGCYHSHPNGRAQPSEHDRASAGEEDFVWLIAALAGEKSAVELVAFAGSSFRPLRVIDRPPALDVGQDRKL